MWQPAPVTPRFFRSNDTYLRAPPHYIDNKGDRTLLQGGQQAHSPSLQSSPYHIFGQRSGLGFVRCVELSAVGCGELCNFNGAAVMKRFYLSMMIQLTAMQCTSTILLHVRSSFTRTTVLFVADLFPNLELPLAPRTHGWSQRAGSCQ